MVASPYFEQYRCVLKVGEYKECSDISVQGLRMLAMHISPSTITLTMSTLIYIGAHSIEVDE